MKKSILLIFLLFSVTSAQYVKPAPPFAGFKTTAQISALACSTQGTLVWDITASAYNVCTATGTPGTWGTLGGGGGITFNSNRQ